MTENNTIDYCKRLLYFTYHTYAVDFRKMNILHGTQYMHTYSDISDSIAICCIEIFRNTSAVSCLQDISERYRQYLWDWKLLHDAWCTNAVLMTAINSILNLDISINSEKIFPMNNCDNANKSAHHFTKISRWRADTS